LNYAAAAARQAEINYRPEYKEIADTDISQWYRDTDGAIVASREGSEYVRRVIAQIALDHRVRQIGSSPATCSKEGIEPPSQLAISTAKDIAKAFIDFGLIPDAIVPSADGGVAICFIRNQKYADIECFNSGDILAVRYSNQDDPRAWAIQPNAVASDATIQEFSKYLSA
jgi:hypothetical protein